MPSPPSDPDGSVASSDDLPADLPDFVTTAPVESEGKAAPATASLPAAESMVLRVAQSIESAIAEGMLPPGTRLVETELAERLGVSRIPVREALKSLEARGLLINRGRRGTWVAEPSRDELEQLVVMRAMLEGMAGRLLACQGTPADIDHLDRLNEAMKAAAATGDRKAHLAAHWWFHQAICEASGNRFLLTAWLSMQTLIRMSFHPQPFFGGPLAQPVESEDALMALIRARRVDETEAFLRNGILRAGYKLLGRPLPAAVTFPVQAD